MYVDGASSAATRDVTVHHFHFMCKRMQGRRRESVGGELAAAGGNSDHCVQNP